jgi:DNA polymerase III subunit delta
MRIKAIDLGRQLKGQRSPLYVIHGIEPLAAMEAADAIRAAVRGWGASERLVFQVEPGFDWSTLVAASASLSLFAESRLIEVSIPTGKPGLEGGKALESLASTPAGEDVFLVLLPELDWSGQQSAWFSTLVKSALVIDAEPLSRALLPRWLADKLAAQGQSADTAALDWFADQVEGNLLAARQEVIKLGFLYPAGELTLTQLEAAVARVSRYESDDLLTAIHQGDASRVARSVAALEAEAAPIQLLLWQLTQEIREAVAVATSGKASRPFPQGRMRELEALARRHGRERLLRLLSQAHDADRWVKGVGDSRMAVDMWRSLLELSLRLAGRASVPGVGV